MPFFLRDGAVNGGILGNSLVVGIVLLAGIVLLLVVGIVLLAFIILANDRLGLLVDDGIVLVLMLLGNSLVRLGSTEILAGGSLSLKSKRKSSSDIPVCV